MPTFESIQFSRELANRLVAISDNGETTAIETPQALLSRNPYSLRLTNEDGTISQNPFHLNGFTQLRQQVANKLVSLSLTGQRQSHIESLLHQPEDESVPGETNDTSQRHSKVRFPGTVTTSQLLRFGKMGNLDDYRLTTGSNSLDNLLGLPPQMTALLSSLHDPNTILNPGIPLGFVFQCSGATATGKTQVALQLAISAALQNLSTLYLASAAGQGSLKPLVSRLRLLAGATATSREHLLEMLEKVSFQVVDNGHSLLACLAEVEQLFQEDSTVQRLPQQQTSPSPRLIILDAASGCLTTEDDTFLQRIGLRLKQLARQYHLLIWINNAASSISNDPNKNKNNTSRDSHGALPVDNINGLERDQQLTKTRAALGAAWKRAWDVHVSFHPIPSAYKALPDNCMESTKDALPIRVRSSLEAHPFKKCHSNEVSTADFCITTQGIQDHQTVSDPMDTVAS